jgi:CheY-like chemotaxis protein
MPKILIVDDEPNIIGMLVRFLEKSGYDVVAAGGGEEALMIFRAQRDIDLVVLDSKMPKMDGVEVLKQMKAISPKVSVIMFSGDINIVSGRLEEFEKMGCSPDDVLAKPITLPLLEAAIKRKLGEA